VIELYPEIWAGEGSLGDLGFGPHPDDYDPVTGKLLPVEQRRPLPYGLVTTQDPTVPEERRTDNVFFTCSACHSGRVYVNGRVRRYIGAPNTEIEAQAYAGLLYRTGKALLKSEEAALTRDQINPAEIARIADFLESKIATDPAWFYGGRTDKEREDNIERAKVQVARILNHFDEAIGALIGAAAKTEQLYLELAYKLSYSSEKDGQPAPGIFGPRPGRMDAFGVAAGLVALHAHRESFFARLPEDHPFFEGLEHLSDNAKYQAAGQQLLKTVPQWMPHDPGPSDIMALWYSRDPVLANWDANQAVEARVIASGVSSVGDPSKVDVRIHEAMNPFINDLPPPPYPFTVNMELAAQGKPLFEQKCATACHHARNPKVYDVGTEMNRAWQISPTARLGLLELTREACELYVEQGGSDWCRPKRGSREEDDEAYFVTPRGDKAGYKANVLHGIWAQAPYLHNGSVPTLWHLLRPAERPATFIRGNINYDEALVGFVWDEAPALDEYGDGDAVHYAEHETHLRGNSNQGHTFGSQWSDDQVRAVIEYMKTL
jgi:mono/diheme cytochrome c family protein